MTEIKNHFAHPYLEIATDFCSLHIDAILNTQLLYFYDKSHRKFFLLVLFSLGFLWYIWWSDHLSNNVCNRGLCFLDGYNSYSKRQLHKVLDFLLMFSLDLILLFYCSLLLKYLAVPALRESAADCFHDILSKGIHLYLVWNKWKMFLWEIVIIAWYYNYKILESDWSISGQFFFRLVALLLLPAVDKIFLNMQTVLKRRNWLVISLLL